jgi:hypothetical protein
MKYYGIFNKNDNYKLLRYSTDEQAETSYSYTNPTTQVVVTVNEVCLPDIEYSEDNIGKKYNPNTGLFTS